MARRGLKPGTCHLCGSTAGLSYEHVPPRSAFNDESFISPEFERLIASDNLDFLDKPRGKIIQGGIGSYTLCVECNTFTGKHYGDAYRQFALECAYFSFGRLDVAKIGAVVKLRPLRVLKQILSMFCSACGPRFATAHPDVVRYVLNKESRDFPRKVQINIALFNSAASLFTRQSGITSSMDLDTGATRVISEICFPPFVIIADFDNTLRDRRFLNIDWFNNFDYNEECERYMLLELLAVNSMFPYDYRTEPEVRSDWAQARSR